MKPRRVVIMIEVETDDTVADIKYRLRHIFHNAVVKQVQVNVIRKKS